MALRYLLAVPLLLVLLAVSVRNPVRGLQAFLVILIVPPTEFFWGFDQWHIPLQVSLAVMIGAALHGAQMEGHGHWSYLEGLVLVLALLLLGSALLSLHSEFSTAVFMDRWLKTFVFVFLLTFLIRDENTLTSILWVIVLSFGLLALRGIYRYMVGYTEIGGALNSTMGDRNDFAMHLIMACPIALALGKTGGSAYQRLAARSVAGLLLLCAILTHSRMGFLMIVCLICMLVLTARRKIISLVVASAVVISVSALLPATYFERMETIRSPEQDASTMGRLNAWRTGWRMVVAYPIAGVGLRCFNQPDVYLRFCDPEDLPHSAHNAYVQLAADAGVPALLVWLGLIGSGLIRMVRVSSGDYSPANRALAQALAMSLVLYLVGAVFLSAEDRELLFIVIAAAIALRPIAEVHRIIAVAAGPAGRDHQPVRPIFDTLGT